MEKLRQLTFNDRALMIHVIILARSKCELHFEAELFMRKDLALDCWHFFSHAGKSL